MFWEAPHWGLEMRKKKKNEPGKKGNRCSSIWGGGESCCRRRRGSNRELQKGVGTEGIKLRGKSNKKTREEEGCAGSNELSKECRKPERELQGKVVKGLGGGGERGPNGSSTERSKWCSKARGFLEEEIGDSGKMYVLTRGSHKKNGPARGPQVSVAI